MQREARREARQRLELVAVENGGVTLLVDPMSLQYLSGAEIDYKDDVDGAQFVIRNPNATTTCGCGSRATPTPRAARTPTSA